MTLPAPIKQFIQEYGSDRVGMLSAAFAYVTIFSIGPLLLVIISIVGFVFGQRAIEGRLYAELAGTLGTDAAKTIQNVVTHLHSKDNLVALVIGLVGVALGAIALTGQLQNSFNAIFDVGPDPKAGIKRTVYAKLKNLLLVLLTGLVITASIVASTLVVAIGHRTQARFGTSGLELETMNSLVFWVIFIVIVYGLYRTIPDIVIPRRIAIIAALAVSSLFLIGKVVLGLIIGQNRTVSAYGAAASFVSLMLWAYYSGQILFVGAEGIKVFGSKYGVEFVPKRFNIKRATIHVDANSFSGKLIEAWRQGPKKLK